MNPERVLRGALIVLGVAASIRGCYLVLFGLPPKVWLPMLVWLAAGVLVHDLLIAPTSLLLGRTFWRLLGRIPAGVLGPAPVEVPGRPVGVRVIANALRGAWLGIGTVLLVGLPLLVGAGQRANPTVIPGRPVLNLFLSLTLVLIGAGAVVVVNLVRRGRS